MRNYYKSNVSSTTGHALKAACLVVLSLIFSGCALPRYTVGLRSVLQSEIGNDGEKVHDYRCTKGAHRGDSVDYRENTLEAMKAAHNSKKYAFVEFDVQYSKDDVIVVFHDKRLFRLFGKFKTINDSTYAELLDLTDGEIATYGDVMDILRKTKINVEIKSHGDLDEDRQLVDYIMEDITERKIRNNILISSISSDVIQYITEKYPETPTGQIFWLTSSTYLPFATLTEKLYKEMNTTGADYLMLHVANLRNIKDLLKFKPEGKTIVFWAFDDSMYVVHKDTSDRLWGDSRIATFISQRKYNIYTIFHWLKPGKKDQNIQTQEIIF